VIVIFLILCLEKVIMADIFIQIFSISDCGLNGWKTNIGTINKFFYFCFVYLLFVVSISIFKTVSIV